MEEDLEKKKLKAMRVQKLLRQNSWQQVKYATLYSDQPQA